MATTTEITELESLVARLYATRDRYFSDHTHAQASLKEAAIESIKSDVLAKIKLLTGDLFSLGVFKKRVEIVLTVLFKVLVLCFEKIHLRVLDLCMGKCCIS